MTSIAKQASYPMAIPSQLPVASSPIAKILKKPDLLSLVFSCLDWNQRRSPMRTCRDFTFAAKKSVLDEMRKTTDLAPVFHKYVCWHAHKKYQTFPQASFQRPDGVFEQLVGVELKNLNSSCRYLSTYLRSAEARTLPILRPLLMQVFKSCPNLTTINLEDFYVHPPDLGDPFKFPLHWDDIFFEVLNISNAFNPDVTTLHLRHRLKSANSFIQGPIYPQLSTLSFQIKDLGELRVASTFITKFPKLENLQVTFAPLTRDDWRSEVIKKEDLLLHDLPRLTRVKFHISDLELIERVGGKYSHLKELEVDFETEIKKGEFRFFVPFFHEITHLKIHIFSYYSRGICEGFAVKQNDVLEEGLQIITTHCKKLREITLEAPYAIKLQTAINFCQSLPELTSLNLISMVFKTQSAIELLLATPKLTHFTFNHCPAPYSIDKITREVWNAQKIEEVRKTFREEKSALSHKRRIAALDEDEGKSDQPAPASAPAAPVNTTVERIEENTANSKKARKEE